MREAFAEIDRLRVAVKTMAEDAEIAASHLIAYRRDNERLRKENDGLLGSPPWERKEVADDDR